MDFVGWVRGESREIGAPLDEPAATLLVQAVGQDLRALAGAVDQLAATQGQGEPISADIVRKYFGGRADVRGYEIADAAIEGRFDVALERVRWAESAKVAAPVIVSALAAGLRSLAKLADVEAGVSDVDAAKRVGAPPFKIRSLKAQLRDWNPHGLAAAMDAVAAADLDIKSRRGRSGLCRRATGAPDRPGARRLRAAAAFFAMADLLVGGLVGVDDTLANGLVELLAGRRRRAVLAFVGVAGRRRPRGNGARRSSARERTALLRSRAASF